MGVDEGRQCAEQVSMYALGVNLSHDRSACLIGPGGKLVAIAEERLDRNKHSCVQDAWGRWFTSMPLCSIRYCLDSFGITYEDLDAVVLCNAVVIDGVTIRNLTVADCVWQAPWSMRSHMTVMNHHLAHAYSAFYPSGFEESAVLVVDKGGSVVAHHQNGALGSFPLLERASFYRGSQTGLNLFGKITDRSTVPYVNSNSLGALYEMATLHIGYTAFDAGKTMGLAPYGDLTHVERMRRFADTTDAGYNISWLVQTVGDAVVPGFFAREFGAPGGSPRKPTKNDMDIARAAQEICEEVMCHLARIVTEQTGSRRLCLAGGVALNSVANTRIRAELGLEEMYVQPASSDDGTAIGAAVYGWRDILKQPINLERGHTRLGRRYSSSEILRAIYTHPGCGVAFHVEHAITLRRVAQLIADGQIVGWFSGGSEFGPRALGSRSILADPRPAEMKDILNARVKHRENYRPYGASVLLERAAEWFECDFDTPFMLFVVPVNKERRSQIGAITHVDNTCRIQTTRRERDGDFHALIEAFYELTGVPVVLNTSFNINKEPIVETPDDAVACFTKTEIDHLYLDGHLLSKCPAGRQ